MGIVVLVRTDNVERFWWPLGTGLKFIPGRDGEFPSVEVKVGDEVLTKPDFGP